MRSDLVAALVARSESSLASQVRRFLRGLSCDELQFIAAFLGTCILQNCEGVRDFERFMEGAGRESEDRELKMILLKEYLSRSGIRELARLAPTRVRLG